MKQIYKSIFALALLALSAGVVSAQQISVVTPTGETTLFTDLNLAIQGAQDGSTVYLSGGGFQIKDETKITKKLTIIGIGHRPDNDNADGNTTVSGNFFFEGGSDGSAVMGLYLSGDVNIGTTAAAVNIFCLRYCNVNSVQVKNSNCQGVLINQNYVRNRSNGGDSPITFSNNITNQITHINGGTIKNNIIIGGTRCSTTDPFTSLTYIYSSTIIDNVIENFGYSGYGANYCGYFTKESEIIYNNAGGGNMCDIPLVWTEAFVGPNKGVDPSSNFHLKEGDNTVGVYGGTGFSDKALPPGPRIVSKKIAEQTDANGNLPVEITVSVEP
ncbi:MAG: hypothetical protein LBE91_21450 [Tannerella sp.]|jgi:hypothetical protein|nr:hypothetical protein [Tannerella sp.]